MYFYHYYNNDGDFQDDYWGTPYHEPWVSKTVLEGNPDHRVNYNKKMKDGYLTFDVKSSGKVYLSAETVLPNWNENFPIE